MTMELEPRAGADAILAAADASRIASRDAESAARAATDTWFAVQDAELAAATVARRARQATATAVATAASSTAAIAAAAAAAMEVEAVTRALDVAAAAVAALETIAAELAEDSDQVAARQTAAAVAATVAADIVTQARSTAAAAAMVAQAVSTAAAAAAQAAEAAAAIVELAAGTAAATGRAVAGSSAATHAASDVVVESTTRVADLAPRLRALAAQHTVGVPADDPLLDELQQALTRDELRLHYQPIYDMRDGSLAAVEALLRWEHPVRGLLLPGDFLHAAETAPLVTPVGDWVLATAVAQATRWHRAFGSRAPTTWVNISCDQLGGHHLLAVVEGLLTDTDLPASMLGLEVTERQLIHKADEVADELSSLHKLGLSLAVDDFGTGYASFDYLRRFAFDEIKIDKSFVAGLGRDATDTAVTASIVALARSLDLTVVAEGVETREQYDYLHRLGCTFAQGYLLHRPATPRDITALLHGTA